MIPIKIIVARMGQNTPSRSKYPRPEEISYLTLFLFLLLFNDLRVNLNQIIERF